MVRLFARNWWVLLLRGIFAVLFGVMAFLWPGITLVTLILLCGLYFIVDGITETVMGGRSRTWSLLIAGVLSIIAGVLTFFYPGVTAFVLLVLVAAWAVIRGIFEVIAAIRLRRELANEWLLVIAGVISILFGVLLLSNPAAGALAMVWLIGLYALLFGITMMILAFRLRGLPHRLMTA
jgi:uncharacterized membrane protein HdeD (DUF308 family)